MLSDWLRDFKQCIRTQQIAAFIMWLRRIALITGIAYLLAACASTSEWATTISWTHIDITNLPTQEDYPDDPAVMLFNSGKIEIYAQSENRFSVFDRHQVVKIFEPRGYKYANIMIPYGSQSQVESIQARTIAPDGRITVLDPEKIYDVNLYPDFIFYSDQRAKIFTMPAVENGCIIEYRYSVTINSSTYGNSWRFQEEIPLLLSRFTLLKPSEWDVEYRQYGFETEPEIVEAPAGFKSSLVWEIRDMPPIKSEIAMPPRLEVGARLALSPVAMRTWQQIGSWYFGLIKPQMELAGDLATQTAKIVDGIKNDKEKLKAIFEWTRDRVRYIAVAIGIGGYQPNPVQDILFNKYGDCKDMTTLMCAIAGEAGIDVYPALISTRNHGLPDTSLPAVSQFNHVIAYCPTVGAEGTWLDATDKTCPFGQLPWYDQGVPVLLIHQDSSEIIYTPGSEAHENRSLLDWDVNMDTSGTAQITGKTMLWGATANEIRQDLYFTSPDNQRRWLEFYLARRCPGAEIESYRMQGVYSVSDPLQIEYTFSTPSFASKHRQLLTFQPAALSAFDLPDYFRSPGRIHPVRFQFPSQAQLNIRVKIPEGWKIINPLVRDSLQSEFGAARWVFESEENTLNTECMYTLRAETIDPDVYFQFREFLDQISRNDLYPIVLQPDR